MHAVIRLDSLLFQLALPVAGGMLFSRLSGDASAVYQSIYLPSWAPAPMIFPIVWTILYLLMGGGAYLATTTRGIALEERRSAMLLYGMMLLINFLWSPLFFRFRLFTFSALWLVLVLAVTMLCAAVFYRTRKSAGLLMIPTILWLIFAGILNFSIATMN